MNLTDAVKNAFRNYANITGRAPRAEYWYFVLFILIASAITSVLDAMIFPNMQTPEHRSGPLTAIFFILILVPSIAVGVRRLHDIDKSGWWMLINLVPLVGWLILIFWYCKKGDDGVNRFGLNPLSLTGKIVDAVTH